MAVFLTAPADSVWQVCAFFVPLVAGVGLLAVRVVDRGGAQRGPLRLLLGAHALYLATSLIWYLRPVVLDRPLAFPSFVDVLYFLAYGGYAVALLQLLRGRVRDSGVESRIALTDALILTVSLSTVLWVAVVDPNLSAGGLSWSTAVAVLYPGFTLVLFGLAARLAVEGDTGRSVPGVLLLVWIGAEISADSVYGYQSANGAFEYSGPLTAVWMVSYIALAGFAAHPAATHLQEASRSASTARGGARISAAAARHLRLGGLLSAALVPVVLMWTDRGHSAVLLGGTVLAVVLVILRGSLLAGDLNKERQLALDLEDAAARGQDQRDRLEDQAHELKRLAFHDLVTGLGNRALLHERAITANDSLARTALLLLDLDGFKTINDTLGHAAGDALLLQVGDRLGRCVRTFDTVVRLGGDEFALLLPETGSEAAMRTAQRVLAELRAPFTINGSSARIGGSIGVTTGEQAAGLEVMLRSADLAMYEAKTAGRDQACAFEPRMFESVTRQMTIESDLRRGIVEGDFAVYYQPIVNTASGEVTSVEALVRWDHPERGVLPPVEFLPVAECSGVIVELGRLVLRTACAQVALWRQDWPDLSLAVNVSHRELLHPGFAAHITAVLDESSFPPAALHLEVTETVLAAEENITATLEPLAAAGVRFSIDDFGTGHSSLSRLRRLQVDKLKIDKSFMGEINDGDSAPLLASIIAMAHSVGHTVVAEGVETAEQAAFLSAHGCDELQGYLVSRPVPPGQLVAVLLSTGMSPSPGHASNTVFATIIGRTMDDAEPLTSVLPSLLHELTALSGLQCAFVADLHDAASDQVTRYAHVTDPDTLPLDQGMAVDWPQRLRSRLLEDDVVWTDTTAQRDGDVEMVDRLGLKTYIAIPVRDGDGAVCGTLCGASGERHTIDPSIVELMHVFAQALGGRLARHPTDEATVRQGT